MNRRLAVAIGVGFVNVMPPAFAGAMGVQMMQDLRIGPRVLGLSVSAFFLINTLISPVAGTIVDRLGPRNGVRVATGISTAGMVAIALLARDQASLLAIMLVAGIGTSFGGPVASLLLADGIAPRRLGLAFGMKQAAIPGANVAAGLMVPIAAGALGWRGSFLTGAVAGLLVLVSAAFLPARRHLRSGGHGRVQDPWTLWQLAGAFFLASATANALNSFVVAHGVQVGLAQSTAGILLALGSGTAIVMRVLAGWQAGQRDLDPLALAGAMVGLGSIGCIVLAVGGDGGVGPGALLALGGGWGWTGLLTYAVTRANHSAPAGATGIIQVGGAGGGIAGPLVAGWLADGRAYANVWTVGAAAYGVSALLLVLIARRDATASFQRRTT